MKTGVYICTQCPENTLSHPDPRVLKRQLSVPLVKLLPSCNSNKALATLIEDARRQTLNNIIILGCARPSVYTKIKSTLQEYDLHPSLILLPTPQNPGHIDASAIALIKSELAALESSPETIQIATGQAIAVINDPDIAAQLAESPDSTIHLIVVEEPDITSKDNVYVIIGEPREIRGRVGEYQIILGDTTIDAGQIVGIGDPREGIYDSNQAVRVLARVGGYEKPIWIESRPNLCAGSCKGIKGCTLCQDQCPVDAAGGDGTVDHAMCTGCLQCTECPTGALHPSDPILKRITKGLEGGDVDCLVFNDADVPDDVAYLQVDTPTILSEYVLLAAAMGAVSVVPPGVDLPLARKVLDAFGLPGPLHHPDNYQRIPGATQVDFDSKREVLVNSIKALEDGYGEVSLRVEMFGFGEVGVCGGCTSCGACVGLCPTDALQMDSESGVLSFTYAWCVGCGLCERGCPEGCLKVNQVFDLKRITSLEPRVLVQPEVEECKKCGRPYMSSQAKRVLLERLGDREYSDLFDYCEDCRGSLALERELEEIL